MEINKEATMFPLDTDTRAGRMMQAGQVTVTFTSKKTGEHITLTAKARGKDENDKWTGCPLSEALVVFIEVPNSGGWNDKVGKVTRSKGFVADRNADPARTWCAGQLLNFLAGREIHADLEAAEANNCGVCGRELTDPVSIARGIGPTCLGASTGSVHETKTKPEPKVETPAPKTVFDLPIAAWAMGEDEADHESQYEAWNRQSDGVAVTVALHNLRHHGTVGDEDPYAGLPLPSPRDADYVPRQAAYEASRARVKTDKSGVPLAVGDWKARKAYAKAARAEDKKIAAAKPTSQNRIFAETGTAIPY